MCVCVCVYILIHVYICINTGWNDRIVVLKKTTLQLYLKLLLKKSSQVT